MPNVLHLGKPLGCEFYWNWAHPHLALPYMGPNFQYSLWPEALPYT
jgi:hypothetical protein